MVSTPVILLSFANSESQFLPMLKAEGQALGSALAPLEQRGFIQVKKEESTTTEELLALLNFHKDRLCIFHYGGHAGHDFLELEGKDAQADGLAAFLGEQANLQLVFLNGCSTKEQVDQLLAAGVKAVIATSVDIEDEQARLLSSTFYQALANKRSIGRAFNFAKNAVMMAYDDAHSIEVYRGIGKGKQSAKNSPAMPWGLYLHPDHEQDTLRWQLPYYVERKMSHEATAHMSNQLEVNFDIAMILEGMAQYNPDIYTKMTEVRNGEKKFKDSSTFLDLVIESFPWVIGSQLRLLLIFNESNKDRLEQLLSTYLVSARVLYFILLADLWQEINGLSKKDREALTNTIKKPPGLLEDNVLNYDFMSGIGQAYALLQQLDAELFMPEFERFCKQLRDEDGIRPAWEYLRDLSATYQDMSEAEVAAACADAEGAVAAILKEAAFLANYQMLTVRGIQIDNAPFSEEMYELDLGRLNAVVHTSLRLYNDADYRRKKTYTNSHSIVLVPNENEKDLKTVLNLSPFIIDKNTFLNNSAIDLFFFAFEKEGNYHYLSVNHGIYQAVTNKKGTDLIHTGMTDVDFQEGHNVKRKTIKKPSKFSARSRLQEQQTGQQGKPVFAALEQQFNTFKTDFGID